jgi:hypothetical protein
MKRINYNGVAILVSETGDIYREAHTTVDRLGKVHKYPRRRLNACVEPSTGYLRVGLRINGVLHNLSVHRLVAQAFLGDPEPGQVINHINEDKTDNCLDNLEWVTQKQNIHHSLRRHPEYRLNRARPVIQLKDGVRVATYASAREAERLTGIGYSGIGQAARGALRSFHGFEWRFV